MATRRNFHRVLDNETFKVLALSLSGSCLSPKVTTMEYGPPPTKAPFSGAAPSPKPQAGRAAQSAAESRLVAFRRLARRDVMHSKWSKRR